MSSCLLLIKLELWHFLDLEKNPNLFNLLLWWHDWISVAVRKKISSYSLSQTCWKVPVPVLQPSPPASCAPVYFTYTLCSVSYFAFSGGRMQACFCECLCMVPCVCIFVYACLFVGCLLLRAKRRRWLAITSVND